jgi:asparagine synthetase B (glutamine-hydrolysing)
MSRLIPSSHCTDSGAQPLTNQDDSLALAVNGEIYNHRVIRKTLKTPYYFKTHSDCEVIIPLVSLGPQYDVLGQG